MALLIKHKSPDINTYLFTYRDLGNVLIDIGENFVQINREETQTNENYNRWSFHNDFILKYLPSIGVVPGKYDKNILERIAVESEKIFFKQDYSLLEKCLKEVFKRHKFIDDNGQELPWNVPDRYFA